LDFGAWIEGKRWRNEYGGEIGVYGRSKTWWMELRNGEDGSISSRESEAMSHKN